MKKKLLLADDSVTIQKVVQITFSHDDYELTVVDNGDIAYEKARSQRPDLILADVFMPGKNGYELCAAVKNDPSLANVPVLLLTGTFEPFDEAKAKSAGADRWIAKPFESQALIACVEELLTLAPQSAIVSPPVLASIPVSLPVEAVELVQPDLSDDIWESDLVAEGIIGSDDRSVADSFVATSQDDLWDVSGFETEPSAAVAGSTASDDLWGSFEEDSSALTTPAPAVVDVDVEADVWGSDAFSSDFAATTPDVRDDFDAGVIEFPIADDVEILEEIDLLEPVADSASEILSADSVAVDDFSFAEVAAPSIPLESIPVSPIATPLPLPVMEVAPKVVSIPAAVGTTTESGSLSDAQLELIVERVAGVVISRLAGTLLEKIVWEVVPDLAETMIKEELRRIRESVAAD